MRIAGIDQGTTSTRSLCLDDNGELTLMHSVEHEQIYPQDGWVEHNPNELVDNVIRCIEACGAVDAIGIDNQGESCLAWHSISKKALSPVIVWQDKRTTGRIEQLESSGFASETLARAGLPLDPYFSASKLAWIVQNIREAQQAFNSGHLRLGTTDAYFLDRLTGQFFTDITTASRTSLMNLHTGQWDPVLCQAFDVPIETLPEIVATTYEFGSVRTKHGNVPIVASIVDQQAALYGFGCRQAGDAKITFGTGAFALMLTGETIVQQTQYGLLPTVAWGKQGHTPVYALDGGVYTASAAINWGRSLGLFDAFEEINEFSTEAAADRGLIFVPALSGLGCPYWEPRARGQWLGLSIDQNAQTLMQSILEGIALRTAEVVDAMHRCKPINGAVRIDGGLSNNPYFVQFLTDVLERPVDVSSCKELTAMGTVQLAAEAIGNHPPLTDSFQSFYPATDRRHNRLRFKQAVGQSRQWSQSA